MKKTESSFGLIKIGDKVSADNGETFLPPYSKMTDAEFSELVADIEDWLDGERLTAVDIADLKEILDV